MIGKPTLGLLTLGKRRLKQSFLKYLVASGAKYFSKLTSEQAGIGLRRESVNFPDLQKAETLKLVIWGSKFTQFDDFLSGDTPTPPPPPHIQTLQYRNNVSSRMANRYTRIFDAG